MNARSSRFISSLLAPMLCTWIILGILCTPAAAAGCPLINGMIDYNCDGKIKITFVGDSIVRGVGDSLRPVEGYPGRIQREWPWAEIQNIGIPGITSGRLLSTLKKNLSRGPNQPISAALHNSDIIAVTVGVNDYWAGTDTGVTIGNIASTVSYLTAKLRSADGVAPFIVVGTLLQSRRSFQQPFILGVNRLLLKYNSTRSLPVLLRFDTVDVFSRSLLNSDKLHPNSAGYGAMQSAATLALQGAVQRAMSRQRSDRDMDGIYDQVEPVFGTSPTKRDTDGDTLSDGDEIFLYRTDPTLRDTDGDGVDDNNKDILPAPTPTPTPTASPTP